jgi:uncharacterized membrane protein
MKFIPDPLHPAVVHFPVVLIVLGAVAAFLAAFWRGGQLPRFTAVLLVLGALGAWAAMETGEDDGGLLENSKPQVESLVDAHIMWAKRTLGVSIVAAVAAVGSAVAGRWPRVARSLAAATALAALAAAYTVYETGHRGGALVFRHGAGVAMADNQPRSSSSGLPMATVATRSIRTDRD